MGIPVLKPSGLVKLLFDRSELMVMRTFNQRRFSFVRVLGYVNPVITEEFLVIIWWDEEKVVNLRGKDKLTQCVE